MLTAGKRSHISNYNKDKIGQLGNSEILVNGEAYQAEAIMTVINVNNFFTSDFIKEAYAKLNA